MKTSKREGKRLFLFCGVAFFSIVSIGFAGYFLLEKYAPCSSQAYRKIVISGIPYSFSGYMFFVGLEKGFFQEQHLDVEMDLSYAQGRATLQAVVDGEADFGVSSETPFMRMVLDDAPISTFATTVTAHDHLAIIARKDRGIKTVKDIQGKNIGVTKGSNGEYFLDFVLLLNGIDKTSIQSKHVKPAQMGEAILSGTVDAVTTWNPQKTRIINLLGESAIVFDTMGLYSPRFIVAATNTYIRENHDIVAKVTRALENTSAYIQLHPVESKQIAAKFIGVDGTLLMEQSSSYHFGLSMDQSFILSVEDQARWAIKNRLVKRKTIPNFLDYVYLDALKEINPEHVTILK